MGEGNIGNRRMRNTQSVSRNMEIKGLSSGESDENGISLTIPSYNTRKPPSKPKKVIRKHKKGALKR